MLKVLIIDDEPYVREGLKYIIPWEEYGFEVCGDAVDGDDGFSKIVELNPDLVLIDIKMPGKTGLEVINESYKNSFKGKFVIISGYSDFQYAKTAIKYGVKSYLLKPIDEEELIEIIKELSEEIRIENTNKVKEKINSEVLREYNLQQLILGRSIESYDEIKRTFINNSYQIALVSNEFYSGEEEIIQFQKFIKENLINLSKVDMIKIEGHIVLVFKDTNINYVIKVLDKLKSDIERNLEGQLFMTVGEIVNSIIDIGKSYKSAYSLMNRKFLYLDYGIVTYSELENVNMNDFSYGENEIANKVHSYVEIGEIDKVVETLRLVENFVRAKIYSEEKVKVLATKLFLELKDKIMVDYNLAKDEIRKNEDIIQKIYGKNSLRATIDFLIEEFTSISKKICNGTSDTSIKRIVKYIDKNYYRDLKLELLAEIFNYNSAYLGKVFKNYTGVSFNTYLDKVRIEEAKKLLMEDKLKVYQVCEKVGYKNIDYFHSKFKKYVGTSPLNYKKTIESEKELVGSR